VTPLGSHGKIFAVVKRIPRGSVATYGDVARIARLPGQARLVGYALHTLKSGTKVPWHRVINAQGRISLGDRGGGRTTQRLRLLSEGVVVSANGRIPLSEFRWKNARRRG
jgi:methylated-DNA-protein-cysteine methyltransferase-like protein